MSAATLAVVVLTSWLGHWQHRRAEEKTALARDFEMRISGPVLSLPASPVSPGDVLFHRATVRGEYDAAGTFFLDNKLSAGVAGYHVITPMKIAGSQRYVLVNRGWVAAGPRRDVLPVVPTPAGEQTVQGVAVVPSSRFLELAPDAPGPVRQNLVISRLESERRIQLHSVVLEQTSEASDGLVRKWERPDVGVERHRAYSLQWYSLAALAALLYVVLNIKRT